MKMVKQMVTMITGTVATSSPSTVRELKQNEVSREFKFQQEVADDLPGASIDEAKTIAERLREKVEQLIIKESRSLRVTVSVGVANIHQVTPNIDVLLAAADQALYQAKRKGRNKVCCFK